MSVSTPSNVADSKGLDAALRVLVYIDQNNWAVVSKTGVEKSCLAGTVVTEGTNLGIIRTAAFGKTGGDVEMTLYVYYDGADQQVYTTNAEGIDGWTYIGTGGDGKLKPLTVTYPYIYAAHYTDQHNRNWVATKNGNDYDATSDTQKIASSVGYDGVKMRVYIWMEGTDADCVNNAAAEDPATYNVNVKLAGISAE